MFEQKSLNKIDGDYFNIIIADSQDVTIQSRNTGHYWYLHCAGYPTEEALVIFHKHRFSNSDMADIIDKISCEIMMLVGDTYQIESITFGNWFSMAKYFVPAYAWNELLLKRFMA